MTKTNSSLVLILISIFAVLTSCTNGHFPDETTDLICDPGSMMPDSFGCLPGCDGDASAYFCTADGRGEECRILAGHTCITDPGCLGGGLDCVAGVGACLRHGTTSCPAGSSTAVCGAVAGTSGVEICDDGIDNDCDGNDAVCPEICTPRAEICGDGIDQDCNGSDIACASICTPRPEICGNGIDEDCNGSDIACAPSCVVRTEICGNSIDEDCNGSDLACPPVCTITNGGVEICDSLDNDCDGFTDEGGVCAICEDNLGGTLRIRPSAALRATCARGLVTVVWGPEAIELRSAAGADSYSVIMTSSWRGWVRLQAFCPDDPSRGTERGYWAGTTTNWSPLVGSTLRSAGYVVDIDGRDLSDAGYVCRESSLSSLSKPHVPLDECSTFACPL